VNEKIIKTEMGNFDKIPLEERMAFQRLVLQSMLGEKPIYKTDEEWREEKITWVETYAKIISDIIDDTKNKEMRNLIMKGEYEKASNIIVEMLKTGELKKAA
jgi:hypothetical protein